MLQITPGEIQIQFDFSGIFLAFADRENLFCLFDVIVKIVFNSSNTVELIPVNPGISKNRYTEEAGIRRY